MTPVNSYITNLFMRIAWNKVIDFWKSSRGKTSVTKKDEIIIKLGHYFFEKNKVATLLRLEKLTSKKLDAYELDDLLISIDLKNIRKENNNKSKDALILKTLEPTLLDIANALKQDELKTTSESTDTILKAYTNAIRHKRALDSTDNFPKIILSENIQNFENYQQDDYSSTSAKPSKVERMECWKELSPLRKKILLLSNQPKYTLTKIALQLQKKYLEKEKGFEQFSTIPELQDLEDFRDRCKSKDEVKERMTKAERTFFDLFIKKKSDEDIVTILKKEREEGVTKEEGRWEDESTLNVKNIKAQRFQAKRSLHKCEEAKSNKPTTN